MTNQWTVGGWTIEDEGEEINGVISEIHSFHLPHDVGHYVHVVSMKHRHRKKKIHEKASNGCQL